MGISVLTHAGRAMPFLAFAAAAFGQCSSTVNPSAQANTASVSGAARSAVPNVAGNAATLTDRDTASAFVVDEPLSDVLFDCINLMRINSITAWGRVQRGMK